MTMPPTEPKIYHIVHVDRLVSIVKTGALLCDTAIQQQPRSGTTIGMGHIKEQRRTKPVKCWPGLRVGDCVPFYFCPRSVMLFKIHKASDPALHYRGGQDPIVHLEVDLRETIDWAEQNQRRWAFTLSNAGSRYFEGRCDLTQLDEIDRDAVQAQNWMDFNAGKQAEFLVEESFPWALVQRIGVLTPKVRNLATETMCSTTHNPAVRVQPEWYY